MKCDRRFHMSVRWKSSHLGGPVRDSSPHMNNPLASEWFYWFSVSYQRYQIGFIHSYSLCSIRWYISVFTYSLCSIFGIFQCFTHILCALFVSIFQFFASTLCALYVGIFQFCISITSKLSSMRSPLCIIFWSIKCASWC